MNNPLTKDFFLNRGVVKGCESTIESRFQTLIMSRREKPFEWYQALGLDKGNASRIRRGLTIPPEWLRVRIASYFGVDSSVIWKIPEILSIDKLKIGDEDGQS